MRIDAPIGRSKHNIRAWATGNNARGELRDAQTYVTVLQRIGVVDDKASTEKGTYTFVECRPQTGRTHQIRVHVRSINHPIVCDALYAPNRIENDPTDNLGFTRLALHARSLAFVDQEGIQREIIAPYPVDFDQAIALIAKKN
jgi:23S rRNA-/tRNA-specific pseudouridylate synthase